ncbi:hypothetical protein PHO31112_05104 [Pandoraea horticolens]|uniref:ParB/Sulfiredoxin domain-containing protein n=1 Tax=Pandoraea horticolens TaxID=2508298 RepID=A0A5E4Z8K1_9BURK|nr:hypothetical protein [Pandoraea horticolens]VVE56640.1 hypothetical protein PHO31112_05104 [Pandoraea horticolens]
MAREKTNKISRASAEEYIVVSSSLVHLDSGNPRHIPLEREEEIIRALCDPQLVSLATDIAKMGALSPLEIMGVIEHTGLPGHYVAVEGNRRTCALLLLADPSRAPTPEYAEAFKRIAQNANIPRELRVFVFPDRVSAEPWIDRRHLGQQSGVGTREWDTPAKARAAARSSANTTAKADVLALRVLDRLAKTGHISAEQRQKVSLTTLSRYLNNASRRAILGLKGLDESNQLIYTHDPSEVDAVLTSLVLDSLPNDDRQQPRVHSRSNAEDRDAYVQGLAATGMIPSTRLPMPVTALVGDAVKHPVGASRPRSSTNTADRNKLMLSSFTVQTNDKTLLRLRNEMLTQPIEHHEFAANYLLRAFVERIQILYLRRKDPNRQFKNEQDLAKKCADDATAANAPRKVRQVLDQASSGSAVAHNLHTLGTAVHLGTIPVRRQLVAVFDTWEAALKYMLSESR